jgi:MoxR-like ATPase
MVKERIKSLLDQLNKGIYEKEEVMALALLSSIAGESIFLLGPPGVAKSLIARRLKYAYKDAKENEKNDKKDDEDNKKDNKSFEYLMSRFSTPDEIFGPVSISELKKDKYVRITDGYLPKAKVVFLDEIWKAGPSIQNALLTVLNEKKFRNGENEEDVPMKALISASNELPAKDQGLEALWDRFIVRLVVEGIEDPKKFNEMIAMDSTLFDEKNDKFIEWGKKIDKLAISDSNDYEKWSKEIDQIDIPPNVFNVIDAIRKKIELHNQNKENKKNQISVSDRRWRKIVRLMRTSAFLNDRKEVDLMDCFLIKHCIWNEEEQIQTVSVFVNDAIREHGPEVDLGTKIEEDQFQRLVNEVENNTRKKVGDKPKKHKISNIDYYKLENNCRGYSLIESSTIDKLTDNSSLVTIFTDNLAQQSEYQIRKSKEKNSIDLLNSSWQSYQLLTEPDIKPYKKSPTRGDYQIWNDDTDKLLSVLNEKKTKAIDYWNTFSESFYGNLFIDKDNADSYIKSKIDAVLNEIDKLKISINEIRNNYQRIYKPDDR